MSVTFIFTVLCIVQLVYGNVTQLDVLLNEEKKHKKALCGEKAQTLDRREKGGTER